MAKGDSGGLDMKVKSAEAIYLAPFEIAIDPVPQLLAQMEDDQLKPAIYFVGTSNYSHDDLVEMIFGHLMHERDNFSKGKFELIVARAEDGVGIRPTSNKVRERDPWTYALCCSKNSVLYGLTALKNFPGLSPKQLAVLPKEFSVKESGDYHPSQGNKSVRYVVRKIIVDNG